MNKILCTSNSRPNVLIDVGDGRLRLAQMYAYDSVFVEIDVFQCHVQRPYGEGDTTKAGKLVKNTDPLKRGVTILWSRVKEFYVLSREYSDRPYKEDEDVSAELF